MAVGDSKVWSSAAAILVLVVVGLAPAVFPSSEAYVFYAGGYDGWVVDPTESYNHWAERNRFQVNDAVVFTYDVGVNSVLLVTEQDFDACNTQNPVRRLEYGGGGDRGSVFTLDRSGPFFFISGDEDRCQKGQKLYIIVMAVRPTRPAAAAAPDASQWTAQAPGMSALGASGDEETSRSSSLGAPPPTSAAARLDEVIIGTVVGILGALLL